MAEHTDVAIGINIGTSQCSVAVWNCSEVELLSNNQDQKMMKSFVSFKDKNHPKSGVTSTLANEDELFSGSVIYNIKRLLCIPDTDPAVHQSKYPFLMQSLNVGDMPLIAPLVIDVWTSTTPEEALAILLQEVKGMAETQLKRKIQNAVLTIPVSFSRYQQEQLTRACDMSGLRVLKLIPEPTAVALLYAQLENKGSSETEKIALIFNMGAGFCDVSVTTVTGGICRTLGLAGATLGGEDIIQNTMCHLFPSRNMFSTDFRSISDMGLLRAATQDAIHNLSDQFSVEIKVNLWGGKKVRKVLERESFEDVNSGVFKKCKDLIFQCLCDANIKVGTLNAVILVGGCSKIPAIRKLVTKICGKTPYLGINPLEGAVQGAALEGAIASGIEDLYISRTETTLMCIGIQAQNKFVPIVPRHSKLPARETLSFTTMNSNQQMALIIIYEGNEEDVKKNHLLGYFMLKELPVPPRRNDLLIHVSIDVDISNTVKVSTNVTLKGISLSAMEVRMPNFDGGHGRWAEKLSQTYGSDLDLVPCPVPKSLRLL